MMHVLVTGANGFVGTAVLARLAGEKATSVRGTARQEISFLPAGAEYVHIGDLGSDTRWDTALQGVDVVVHTAARVHMMRDPLADPLREFCRINVEGTLNLARQAVDAGVRRFVFVSSVKVNGERTEPGKPFSAADFPRPVDPYAVSKYEAELGLRRLEAETGLEVVIIRPPLVYGQGVKANFLVMMRWLQRGIPLPLGAVRNKRSLVALDNLVDLIAACVRHPAAAGQIFMVSDGEDLSLAELLQRLGTWLGVTPRLISLPPSILKASARLLGRPDVVGRLCDSLQVDIGATCNRLGWVPPIGVDDALQRTARHFLEQ